MRRAPIEIQVGFESDSEYWYTKKEKTLILPPVISAAGPLTVVVMEVFSHNSSGKLESHKPTFTYYQSREEAFPAFERRHIQDLVDRHSQGFECPSLHTVANGQGQPRGTEGVGQSCAERERRERTFYDGLLEQLETLLQFPTAWVEL